MDDRPDDTMGRQAIVATVKLLAKYPGVEYEQGEGELAIKGSVDGFDIVVRDEGQVATIGCSYWHDDFTDPEEVAKFVVWLLSPRMRLKVTYRGKHSVKGVVESKCQDGSWTPESVFGLLIPIIGKKRTAYLGNSVVDPNEVPFDS